jgi:hypothetical protein
MCPNTTIEIRKEIAAYLKSRKRPLFLEEVLSHPRNQKMWL